MHAIIIEDQFVVALQIEEDLRAPGGVRAPTAVLAIAYSMISPRSQLFLPGALAFRPLALGFPGGFEQTAPCPRRGIRRHRDRQTSRPLKDDLSILRTCNARIGKGHFIHAIAFGQEGLARSGCVGQIEIGRIELSARGETVPFKYLDKR